MVPEVLKWSWLIAVHALLLVLLAWPDIPREVDDRFDLGVYESPETASHPWACPVFGDPPAPLTLKARGSSLRDRPAPRYRTLRAADRELALDRFPATHSRIARCLTVGWERGAVSVAA